MPRFRPPDQFIPPVQEPYAYIIFRASEVKDLAVDESQPRRTVHDDPAVIGVSSVFLEPPLFVMKALMDVNESTTHVSESAYIVRITRCFPFDISLPLLRQDLLIFNL